MDSFDESYTRKRSPSGKAREKSKKDWLTGLCAVQLILAAIGILLLFAVSKVSPAGFNELKNRFFTIMERDMSASQVADSVLSLLPVDGAGGEDTQVYLATESVSFAPIETTVEMHTPVEGRITSRFGYRKHPITGKFGIHNGTDIAAPEGTPIAAAFNATVEETGYNDVRGNYVLLSHGGDTKTLYLHCSQVLVSEGTVVRQGETIALVGNTGWSTGPHLHFSIIIAGKYCNPEWLLE